jgi:hypothetical protein
MNNNTNASYLKILGIFHFIVAAMALFYALVMLIYMVMGLAMMAGGGFLDSGINSGNLFGNLYGNEEAFPAAMFGMMFTIIPGIYFFFIMAFVVCMVIAGVSLLKKKNYYFCMVMAGISCLFVIFGTILGVFTLIVLAQPASKELFTKKGVPPALPVTEAPSPV